MNWLEKLAAPLKPAAKSVVETVKKTIKEQPPVQPKPKENYVIPPVAEFVPALKQYQEAENNKGNLVWGQEGFAEQQAERVLTPAVESVGAFIKSGTDAMYNAEMELGKTLYPATKAVYESSIKPFGTYTSAVAAAPFVSAYKSAATVAGGMTDLGASIRETTVDPLARTMTPYYKQVADWTKGQLDRVDWDKFFTGLDVAAETFSKTTSGTFAGGSFDVLTKPANLVGKAAAHLRASEVAEDVKPAINFFETLEKKGLQGAILGAGLYIDILERPVFRKNLLPQLFSNLSLLSKVSSGQGLTEDDIIESKLSAEYMAGGSVNGVSDTSKFLANQLIDILNPFGGGFMNPEEVESYVDYMTGTETRYRAEKLPEITEYVNRKYNNSLTPQEVKQMIESRTIFGLSAQGVLDTVISYSASIAEASLGKVLTNRALGPAANFVGMVMEKAQKMVYPAALGTLALDQAMVSGILGKDKMMGLAKWIDENDLDLQQDVAVLSGIAVLGTAIKGLGKGAKAAGGLFGLNWGQTLKGLDITKAGEYLEESWKKWAKDPATLKQALDNLQRDWVKTVTDMSPKYTKFTVAEINEMRNLLKSLPPEIQKTFRDVNLTLFMRNLYDGMIAGQAQKATKTISLDMDTFRTKIQGGLWEGDRTLVHEWAHLFEEKIWNDPILGPAWKKLIESKNFTDQGVGKGADYSYKYKNPAEYFAEGVSEYIKTPEVLKMEDPDLFNFMGEVVPQFKRLLDIDFDAFKPAEFMPRLDPLYQEALKYGSAEEFEKAFALEQKHGVYYHITDDPNFKIDEAKGPRDMSSLADGEMEAGKLMVTSDLENWVEQYPNRKYVAVIDMSKVSPQDYWQSKRGFGNEFYVDNPKRAKVLEVLPVDAALKQSAKYQANLEKFVTSKEDIYKIWNSAHGGEMMPRAKADASQLLEDIKKAEAAIKEYEQQKLKAPEETVWKDGEPAEVGRKWYDDEIDKEEVYLKEKRGKLINEMVGQWESLWKEWKKAEGQQKEEIKNQMDALSAQIIRQKSAGGPVLNFMPRMDFQEWYDQSPIMGAVRKTVDAAKEVSDYDLANKLITVADPTKLTENGVPKALVPYAVPLRRYATAKEWLTALQENKAHRGDMMPRMSEINRDWYRGVDEKNINQKDKFFSGSPEVAGDYGKVEKLDPSLLPKNPLIVADKQELASLMGVESDPYTVMGFDALAKRYAMQEGHDGIMYRGGSLGEPELHVFEKIGAPSVLKNPSVPYNDQTNNTSWLARERFNIGNLDRIGAGSDRIVFDTGDGKVVKIAKTARGLAQNEIEGMYGDEQILGDLVPRTYEVGKNYIVVEKVDPPTPKIKKMAKEIGAAWQQDYFQTQGRYVGDNLAEVLTKYDLEDLRSYDPLWGDLGRPANWGSRNGDPVIIDRASISKSFLEQFQNGEAQDYKTEFREIKSDSAELKSKAGETDKFSQFMPRMERQLGLESYGLTKGRTAELQQQIDDLDLTKYQPETMKQWQQEANEKLAIPGWLNNTLQSGRPLSASDGIALRSRLNTDADFILSATKRLPTETDPALLQNKIAAAEDLRERILERLVPGKTEQARALVSNRWIAEKSTDFSFWAQKVKKLLAVPDGLDKGPLYDKYKATLSMLQVLTDQKDMMGIASLVSSLKESDFVDKLVTLWKAGLLTSPLTHIRNMGSNTAFLTLETVKEIPAAMIDKLLSSFTGQRTMGLPNLKTMLSAGVPKGYAMAQEVMKYGGTLEDLGKSDFIKQTVFSDSGLGKAADKYTKFIFRLLGAEDKVFRGVIEAMSVTSQAKAMALNEGLKGKAFQARVSELIDKPTSEMIDLAREQSAYGTFNNKNPISDWIMGGKKTPHAGLRLASEVIMPFTRTPTNVALRGLAYSPAGLAKGVLETLGVILHSVGGDKVPALSQMKAAQDVARGLTGGSIIALGAYLAEKGLMTGTYPSAGEEKKRFKALNLRGGDMIIDGKAINIMGISPVGNLLQMGASLYNNVKDQGWLKGVVYTTADYGKGLTEQTFLMGLSNALSALSDPTRYGGSVVGGALAGMVPTVIGQLVEAGDQYQREYNGLFSRLQNRVPGWRQSGLPKLDMFGKPMETSQEQFTENIPSNSARYVAKALMRMTDPFFTRDLPEHELLKEYQRLADLGLEKAYPSEPSERGTITYTLKDGSKQKIKYKMQPESYNLYREITGRLMEKAQAELIASAEYQNLSDENKAKALYRVYEDSRDAAKGIVLPLILEEKDDFGSTVYDKLEKDLKAEQVEEIRVLAQAEGAPSWDPEKLIPRSREVTEIVYQ